MSRDDLEALMDPSVTTNEEHFVYGMTDLIENITAHGLK